MMFRTPWLTLILGGLAVAFCMTSLASADDDDWTPLFNGRDLTGWYVYADGSGRSPANEALVGVDDEAIHFYPQSGDTAKQGYLATETGYSFYRLRFEYRWGDSNSDKDVRDSGVLVHLVGEDGVWPTSIQCQVQTGKVGDLAILLGARSATTVDPKSPAGSIPAYQAKSDGGILYQLGAEEATRRVARQGGREVDGWNHVEVTVAGGSVKCVVNGEEVNYCTDLRQPTPDGQLVPLTAGRIAFQAESSEVFYRKIEIEPTWGGPLDVPAEATVAAMAPVFQRPELTAPAGFEIETAVAPPLVHFPMMACLDDQGRMFVCEAAGVNLFGPDLAIVEPNSILLLEDTDGDGVYDTSKTFADRMTFPSGCVWHDGALYVASAPYIWRLRDTDGDGTADERTALVGKFEDSGIADSLHGPFFAPDGRIYWVHGIGGDGHEVLDAEGKLVVKSNAPGIFSCWPDGSDIRKHCAGGMNNPVELDFTDAGQMIGTVNLLQNRPRDDALVQWVWGGLYPHNGGVIEGLPRTGDLLDSTFSFGHVAVSGLTRLRTAQLGDGYRDSFLVTQFNTQRVVRVNFTPSGSTYTGEMHDFLASSNTDVHFTDIFEDADGSVLVVDTGGWFRNGCPTSQVAKPNVLGAIYRIRRTDAPKFSNPRGTELAWDKLQPEALLKLLDDGRPTVRERAIEKLALQGPAAVPGLQSILASGSSDRAKVNAVWAICRMSNMDVTSLLANALGDSSLAVREAAVHAVFCRRDAAVAPRVRELLLDESLSVRREAATTLGLLQDKSAVPALIEALAGANDRLLEHALIHALIEINVAEQTTVGLAHALPQVQRGALIALDQMPAGGLKRELMASLLDSVDPLLQRTALEIISRREGWAAETIDVLSAWLHGKEALTTEQSAALRGALVAFAKEPKVQELIAETLRSESIDAGRRDLVLESIARMSLEATPDAWHEPLDTLVEEGFTPALLAVKNLKDRSFEPAMVDLAHDFRQDLAMRITAIDVIVGWGYKLDHPLFELLTAELIADRNAEGAKPERLLAAARVLAAAPLTVAQRQSLVPIIRDASPLVLPVLLNAFENDTDPDTGLKLIGELRRSESAGNLPAARLEQVLRGYPADVQRLAATLFAESRAEAIARVALLDQMASSLGDGDVEHGRAVFFGNKAACAACHRNGGEGGNIGPELSQIGRIRTRRDLLEAVVFPSASFARGFESITITTTTGLTHNGVIGTETGQELTLRTGDRAEIRIRRDEIEEMQPAALSIMPQGLDTTLTREELRDLLAFLGAKQ